MNKFEEELSDILELTDNKKELKEIILNHVDNYIALNKKLRPLVFLSLPSRIPAGEARNMAERLSNKMKDCFVVMSSEREDETVDIKIESVFHNGLEKHKKTLQNYKIKFEELIKSYKV